MKTRYNPRKKDEGGTTNATRAEQGAACVEAYPSIEAYREEVVDVLADIFHYCDREGFDVEQNIATAKMHWEAER